MDWIKDQVSRSPEYAAISSSLRKLAEEHCEEFEKTKKGN
jgi:hypothetical protein